MYLLGAITVYLLILQESANMPLSDSDNWVTVPEREFSISEDNIEVHTYSLIQVP